MPGKHLHSLDGLRGVAALVVVLFHWVHFHYGPDGAVAPGEAALPLAGVLWPFYQYGNWSVTLFFSLSGVTITLFTGWAVVGLVVYYVYSRSRSHVGRGLVEVHEDDPGIPPQPVAPLPGGIKLD